MDASPKVLYDEVIFESLAVTHVDNELGRRRGRGRSADGQDKLRLLKGGLSAEQGVMAFVHTLVVVCAGGGGGRQEGPGAVELRAGEVWVGRGTGR